MESIFRSASVASSGPEKGGMDRGKLPGTAPGSGLAIAKLAANSMGRCRRKDCGMLLMCSGPWKIIEAGTIGRIGIYVFSQ